MFGYYAGEDVNDLLTLIDGTLRSHRRARRDFASGICKNYIQLIAILPIA